MVKTLSRESSSSSITPGPGNIFLLEWILRISCCFAKEPLDRLGLSWRADDDSDPDEYSCGEGSSFMESILNLTSMVVAVITPPGSLFANVR